MANSVSTRDIVLLAYKAFDGVMPGRTLLQKRLYFLSVLLQQDLGYDAHYYGPYSAEVANSNSELKSIEFLNENGTSWGMDERGFEKARYDYALSDLGKRVADRIALESPDIWNKIEKAADVLKHAGSNDYMALSMAAKAFYALEKRLGKHGSIDQISEMLPKFGWSVTEDQLSNAVEFLKKAQLVTEA